MAKNNLQAPLSANIDFKPSPKQYELWKLLQPDYCPECGGQIEQVLIGYDPNHNPKYKPQCVKCGNWNLPQLILGGGSAGGGKCLSMNELVLTPNGFVQMREMRVGAIVNTPEGGTAKVIAIHPQGYKQIYMFTTSDGIMVECCGEHLWKVIINGEEQIVNTLNILKELDKGTQVVLPCCKPQFFDLKTIGVAKAFMMGTTLRTRINPEILSSSAESRQAYVNGVIEAKGYEQEGKYFGFKTANKTIADDFLFLVRSLGYHARMSNHIIFDKRNWIYKKAVKWSISFYRDTDVPRYVKCISKGKKIYAQCITIDSREGMFITRDFLPTHNSYLGSVWLISSCIRFDSIRAVVGRKTLKSLKESTWNTIRFVLKDWGLIEDINYKFNNLEGTLTFWNDSVIIMKEMADIPSDPNFERFGSSEYTIALVDEASEISERAIEVLFSRLRWKTHETFKTSRMLLTTNPTTNWVRSRFVQNDNGEPIICREGEAYVPFSVYDNPDITFRQTYEAALNKIRDQATKERLLYGNWDYVDANNMALYNCFDGSKHLFTGLRERYYNTSKPLILVWDFNVAPQMSVIVAQIDYEHKKLYILEEILGKPENKENNTPALARVIKHKLSKDKHIGGVDITGDPSGLQRSTASEEGVNNFTIIMDIFDNKILRPKLKLLRKHPPQVSRCDFVNEVLAGETEWQVLIDIRCRKLTEDLIYQLKNEDGTKSKRKVQDAKTGVKYEKYGHFSDCLDYLFCYYLRDSWNKFKNGGSQSAVLTTAIINEGFTY